MEQPVGWSVFTVINADGMLEDRQRDLDCVLDDVIWRSNISW